jgi:primosomal replication protein N''
MQLTQTSITRLSTIVQQLSEKAKNIDKQNKANKAHKMVENNNLFSEGLFVTDSDMFIDFIQEIDYKITSLARLIKAGKTELSAMALEKIERQIQALYTALNANKAIHDDAQFRLAGKIRSIKARQYKQMAQNIIQSSQELYTKLSEHHEFERRLLEMLQLQENKLAHCKEDKRHEYSQQVLTLHQRLGRCRKAISTIERDIAFFEKR